MGDSRRVAPGGRVGTGVGLVAITLLAVAAAASTAIAQPTDTPKVTISASETWTGTGLTVKDGDEITVRASGKIDFGPATIDAVTPAGRPPAECAGLVEGSGKRLFPAPGESCWALLARVGTGQPVVVGSESTFEASGDGELQLGVNDNRLEDNTGSWTATIAVVEGSGASSNTMLFVIVGLAVVLLALLLWLLARRRRKDDEPITATVVDEPDPLILGQVAPPVAAPPGMVVIDEPVDRPVEETGRVFANVRTPLGTSVAPVEGETVDVNIFEVELANGTDLRVGYNYFPEDTALHWQVRQGTVFAHGQFPTNGGGNMYHYVTLPLGVRLEPKISADVQFTWTIGGVPFRYSVRRDPGL